MSIGLFFVMMWLCVFAQNDMSLEVGATISFPQDGGQVDGIVTKVTER